MDLVPTICAICRKYGNCELVYVSNLDKNSFSAEVFSARRMPDRRHYKIVKCLSCGLHRSDPIIDMDINQFYTESSFDYSHEIDGLKKTYISLTKKALAPKLPGGRILEVGGGNGFYLEAALDSGFSSAYAVEPSIKAVAAARSDIRENTYIDVMKSGLVTDNSFDVVTMFHVLDHLSEPLETIAYCKMALKPNGTFIAAVHNFNSWSSRLLRSKSPIVDIEHTYLYSKNTIKKLFEAAGLIEIKVGGYWNYYSLYYLIFLLPIPGDVKRKILKSNFGQKLLKLKIYIPLGNIWASGKKPE
jgi:2-polyprenyl-3-methyl-5-hydroxy-6-metoxy-1,4-benzoquinol methylase